MKGIKTNPLPGNVEISVKQMAVRESDCNFTSATLTCVVHQKDREMGKKGEINEDDRNT